MDNHHQTLLWMTRTTDQIRSAIGRPDLGIPFPADELTREDLILVTGAAGHLGQPLVKLLREIGATVIATDVDPSGMEKCVRLDVTDREYVIKLITTLDPSLIIHLAADKHAPDGEVTPWNTAHINLIGTKNVLDAGKRTVLVSTCKAVLPETVYGASKLIAERMTLNRGGSVARFYNVPECGPNVVQIWEAVPEDEPLPVTPCTRLMITMPEALALIGWAAVLEPGRYIVDAGNSVDMIDFAHRLFPGRLTIEMPPRRGDRLVEPRRGPHEVQIATEVTYIDQVISWHDASVSI